MTNDSGRLRSAGLRPEPEEVSALRAAVAIARFTPGPWEAFRSAIHVEGKGNVATVQNPWNDQTEREANAALIAAAPDLYEACGDALELLNAPVITPLALNAVGHKLQAVLAKARGDTPNVSGLSHTGVDRG